MLYATFEIGRLGNRSSKRAACFLGRWRRDRAMRNAVDPPILSSANLGELNEVRFDLPTQAAQIDHSVSSPDLIK